MCRDSAGTPQRISLCSRENSEQEYKKSLEQKNAALELAVQRETKANLAKREFLFNMSHDIRTPMNAIIGFTALAQTHIDDRDQVEDYLKKISVSSQHLLSLINDVLDMSRIENGKVTLETKPVHLPELVEDIGDAIQVGADKKAHLLYRRYCWHEKRGCDRRPAAA